VKVGDLVKLSSVGQNTIYCRALKNKTGLIVELRPKRKYMYPIVVSWFGFGHMSHLRSQLKYISKA